MISIAKPAAALAVATMIVCAQQSPALAEGGTDRPFEQARLDAANAYNKARRDSRGTQGDGQVDDVKTASVDIAKARGGEYSGIIARHAAANDVPVALATAVVRIESNFRAGSRGSAGEVGLMQIKPATARAMGFRGGAKALYDPETNIKYGMKYLGIAHRLGGGKTCGTILRYNAGHAAKSMNSISAGYCAKVKRVLGET